MSKQPNIRLLERDGYTFTCWLPCEEAKGRVARGECDEVYELRPGAVRIFIGIKPCGVSSTTRSLRPSGSQSPAYITHRESELNALSQTLECTDELGFPDGALIRKAQAVVNKVAAWGAQLEAERNARMSQPPIPAERDYTWDGFSPAPEYPVKWLGDHWS